MHKNNKCFCAVDFIKLYEVKMLKVSRYLKTPNSKNSPIWFRVNFKGKNIRLSSGITLETKHWNSKSKTISISKTNVTQVNKELLRLEQLIYDITEAVTKEDGSLDLKELSSTYKKELKGENSNENDLLFRIAFDMYIDHCINSSVKKDGTAAVYKTVRNQIVLFEDNENQQYYLSELNRNYFEKFRLYIQDNHGLANITVNKYFRVLKSLSRFLIKRGFEINPDIFDFAIKFTDTNKVVISNDDMAKLKSVNLKTQNQNKYRDLFLILCHIGIRVSDLHNLNESNIDLKNKLVNIHTEKTSAPVSIPVPDDIIILLDQYFVKSNTTIVDQKFNRIIKDVCRLAGIDDPIEIVIERGKKSERKIEPKYNLVTTHTGRRTFITKMMETMRFSEKELMKITGHKSVSSFKKYYQILPDELLSKCKDVMNKGLFE